MLFGAIKGKIGHKWINLIGLLDSGDQSHSYKRWSSAIFTENDDDFRAGAIARYYIGASKIIKETLFKNTNPSKSPQTRPLNVYSPTSKLQNPPVRARSQIHAALIISLH